MSAPSTTLQERAKQTQLQQHLSSSSSSSTSSNNTNKRALDIDISETVEQLNSAKKIKIEVCNNSYTWNLSGLKQKSKQFAVSQQERLLDTNIMSLDNVNANCSENAASASKNVISLNAVSSNVNKDDLIVVRSIQDAKDLVGEMHPSQGADDIFLLTSDLVDYIEGGDDALATAAKEEIKASTVVPDSTGATEMNTETVFTPSASASNQPTSTSNPVDVNISKANILDGNGNSHNNLNSFTLITTMPNTNARQVTVQSNNRVNSAIYSTSGTQLPPPDQVNRTNVQPVAQHIKTQQIVSRKLISEVTQTTAKVSIGNTTISVPLLKPLNSTKIIQTSSGSGAGGDNAKKRIQTLTGGQSQGQINLSKILNVNRNHKSTHPTFMQLHIKPVSTAKIMQAKVVSKKVPVNLPNASISSTSSMQPMTGVVAITSSKAKQGFTQSIFQKITQTQSNMDDELNFADVTSMKDQGGGGVTFEKVDNNQISVSASAVSKARLTDEAVYKSQAKLVSADGHPTRNATIRKIYTVTTCANMPPLSTLSKSQDHQGKAIISPKTALSIIKQPAPAQLSIESQDNPDTKPKLSSASNILTSAPVISIPKNFSVMLSKNSVLQPQKATLVSSNANAEANIQQCNATESVPPSTEIVPKSVSFKMSNVLNISSVNMSDPTRKQSVSVPVQVPVAISSDTAVEEKVALSRKMVKAAGLQAAKRSKSIDELHQESKSIQAQITLTRQVVDKSTKQLLEEEEAQKSMFKDISCTNSNKNDSSLSVTSLNTVSVSVSDKANNDNSSTVLQNSQATITNVPVVSKHEETHNVLLKQLLQSSSNSSIINQTSTSTSTATATSTPTSLSLCTQMLSSRKVVNVRAPSLGLVSSLEAQLARPVIPPVPATNTSSSSSSSSTSHISLQKPVKSQSHNRQMEVGAAVSSPSDVKSKAMAQVISKETSFVSNPSLNLQQSSTAHFRCIPTEKFTVAKDNIGGSMNPSEQFLPIGRVERKSDQTTSSEMTKQYTDAKSPNICANIKDNMISGQGLTNETQPSHDTNKNIGNPDNNTGNQTSFQLGGTFIDNSINRARSDIPEDKRDVDSMAKRNEDLQRENDERAKQASQKDTTLCNTTVTSNNSKNTSFESSDLNELSPKNNAFEELNVKDTETRKKRKRETQKHRRIILNINKDSSVSNMNMTTTIGSMPSSKKKPRKMLKAEEDYDNFIDNLITHLRQMQPLQVLEPLLNRQFGTKNMFGNLNTTRYNKLYHDHVYDELLDGEFGNAQRPQTNDFYGYNFVFKNQNDAESALSKIQNNFYDQEFPLVAYKNTEDKLLRLMRIASERNFDKLEIIDNKKSMQQGSSNDWNIEAELPYPGLLMPKSESLGRMSPVIPFVHADPLCTRPSYNAIDNWKLPPPTNDDSFNTISPLPKEERNEIKNKMVYISLQPTAANNLLVVLKDLVNLLNIDAPISYKITDVNEQRTEQKSVPRNRVYNNAKLEHYIKKQQILSGRRKVCSHCGASISSLGIRTLKNSGSEQKSPLYSSSGYIYYCSKKCFKQIKDNDNEISAIKSGFEKKDIADASNQAPVICNEEPRNEESSKVNIVSKCSFKQYKSNAFPHHPAYEQPTEKEILDCLVKANITLAAHSTGQGTGTNGAGSSRTTGDTRQCVFCCQYGDGQSNGPSRLLNFEVDKWVHLNCALWSNGVYETVSGSLMNFQTALQMGLNQICSACQQFGATVKCFKARCGGIYHLPCAIHERCIFYKNKTIQCLQHASRMEKENELESLVVQRRVFIERDENRQVAAVMHHSELNNLLRIGSLTFLSVGQLLPHQLKAFHTTHFIYPIGYKIIRFYWSMRYPNKRCRYICSISELSDSPEFRIQVQEPMEKDMEFRNISLKAIWREILESIAALRRKHGMVQLFPEFISGEDLFGLTEPAIVRIIESLPGVETLTDYRFKYGRNPLLELPLAINPSGSARTEPKQRQLLGWRKPHTQCTSTTSNQGIANPSYVIAGEVTCPYSKQFVHSKSSQYKKMKQEWRNNVYLARSKIQGLGLYAARDIERHTMIIEYIGEVIRVEVSEIREKQYEARNRGIYMFRLDEDRVVDATLSGGLARYINHSCNPNCVTEIVEVDRELRIIIFAKRRVNRGEELSYDYKFDIEDDANKIPCMCGAPNCRKWMN